MIGGFFFVGRWGFFFTQLRHFVINTDVFISSLNPFCNPILFFFYYTLVWFFFFCCLGRSKLTRSAFTPFKCTRLKGCSSYALSQHNPFGRQSKLKRKMPPFDWLKLFFLPDSKSFVHLFYK